MIGNEDSPSITDVGKRVDDGRTKSQKDLDLRFGLPLRWAVNGGYALLLIIMAVLPSTSRVAELSVPDWLAHSAAYGVQAALLYWASLPSLGQTRALAAGVIGAAAFGVATEGVQLFHPGRDVEFKDVAANCVGALLVCGVIAGVRRFADRRAR